MIEILLLTVGLLSLPVILFLDIYGFLIGKKIIKYYHFFIEIILFVLMVFVYFKSINDILISLFLIIPFYLALILLFFYPSLNIIFYFCKKVDMKEKLLLFNALFFYYCFFNRKFLHYNNFFEKILINLYDICIFSNSYFLQSILSIIMLILIYRYIYYFTIYTKIITDKKVNIKILFFLINLLIYVFFIYNYPNFGTY
jgi:hypothetical protein